MSEQELKEKLLAAAKRIDRRNFQTNNGGNFSCRTASGMQMLVKATDVSFSTVTLNGIVLADFEGKAVFPGIKPSKESVLHGLLYANFPHIGAIMHCHSPWATAWANCMDALENATYHAPLKLGNVVPVFDTQSYAVPPEHAHRIAEALHSSYPDAKAFLLRGHGVMALGKDIEDAVNMAELVEETAQISMLTKIYNHCSNI